MEHIQAPKDYSAYMHKKKVFFAGSIEMGVAELWQPRLVEALSDLDVLILNPRRDDWDSSWVQSIDNKPFREQVEWELDALDASDLIIFYFDPNTKSPITLMELGIHASTAPEKVLVCCPEGFWRKGNVDIVCKRYGVQQVDNFDQLKQETISRLQQLQNAA